MMFEQMINPVFLELGPLQIRYYGLVYAIGFLVAYFLLYRIAKQGKIKNLDEERADQLILYMIIGGIVGGRLAHFLFYNFQLLISHPLEIFLIWHGGMSFHGGIIGMALAIWLFARRNHIKFYKIADIVVLPAAFFLIFGRIANFINSELVGVVADPARVPWCVKFPVVDDNCRHPSQLYEAGKNAVIFTMLLLMSVKGKFKDGVLFWTFVLMYGSLRFIINFWRQDDILFLGISTGQFLSIIMVPVAAYFLWKLHGKEKK
ncbi:prolipoprotein diacylglyceryl transferase [Candidatus Woesearchaeota archaeon]|nr:prolipoprotein diacylglyceryl transferase [Candidatus Woesearchaeota archaeon]